MDLADVTAEAPGDAESAADDSCLGYYLLCCASEGSLYAYGYSPDCCVVCSGDSFLKREGASSGLVSDYPKNVVVAKAAECGDAVTFS